MQTVELIPAASNTARKKWLLELDDHEVRLFDPRDVLVVTLPRDEANRRILFPSFFLSIKHLQIFQEDQSILEFLPRKEAMDPIRAYLDRVLRQDAGARSKLKAGGWSVLLLGLFVSLAGGAFLGFQIWRGTLLHPGRLRIASPFAAILIGVICIAWGIGMIRKAARLGREEEYIQPELVDDDEAQ